MTRVPLVDLGQMNDLQSRIVQDVVQGPRGRVGDLLLVWLHSPVLTDHVQKVGAHFRDGTSVPRRVIEMVILIVARHWLCEVEWVGHAKSALDHGLRPQIIDAIRRGERPDFDDDDAESAAYRFTSSMLERQSADDATVDALLRHFGNDGFVDISILIGHYTHGAIVINGAGLRIPEGTPHPFATGNG